MLVVVVTLSKVGRRVGDDVAPFASELMIVRRKKTLKYQKSNKVFKASQSSVKDEAIFLKLSYETVEISSSSVNKVYGLKLLGYWFVLKLRRK